MTFLHAILHDELFYKFKQCGNAKCNQCQMPHSHLLHAYIHGSKDMHDLVLIFLFMLQSVISLLTHGTSNTDCDVTSYAHMLS